jgi:hypothetical protein
LNTDHRPVCGQSQAKERREELRLLTIVLMDALAALGFSD